MKFKTLLESIEGKVGGFLNKLASLSDEKTPEFILVNGVSYKYSDFDGRSVVEVLASKQGISHVSTTPIFNRFLLRTGISNNYPLVKNSDTDYEWD
jgi:hypothetical protein